MREWLPDIDARDLCAVIGFGSVVYGLSLISVAAAWIIAGMILMAVAVWPVLKGH